MCLYNKPWTWRELYAPLWRKCHTSLTCTSTHKQLSFHQGVILIHGARIGYFQGDIRLLMDDLKMLQPTVFPVVPRLLNRMFDKVRLLYRIKLKYTKVRVKRIVSWFTVCLLHFQELWLWFLFVFTWCFGSLDKLFSNFCRCLVKPTHRWRNGCWISRSGGRRQTLKTVWSEGTAYGTNSSSKKCR